MKHFFDSSAALPIALAGAAAGFLAACAPVEDGNGSALAAGEETRECFFPRNVNGFRNAPDGPDGAERIFVDVGASDTFLFELFAACPDLDFAQAIAFDTTGIGQVCSGLEVDLIVPGTTLGPRRFPVSMIRKLAPDEEGSRPGAR